MRSEVSAPHAAVEVASSVSTPAALVIVLHGGRAWSRSRARRRHLAYLRMVPFSRLWNKTEAVVTVWRLRYRYRGWNGDARDPVVDLRWALEQASTWHPGVPVILIGHSMGGRAALTSLDDSRVAAVCALAPWLCDDDRMGQLHGRRVLIAHGDRDRITRRSLSAAYASRAARAGADVSFITMDGEGHAMLGRPRSWHTLVRGFIAEVVGTRRD